LSRHLFASALLSLSCVALLSLPPAAAQTAAQKGENASASSTAKPVDVAGKWQVAWQGRLGTELCTIELQQDSNKLKGTLQDQRGFSPLSGTVDGKKVTFDVQFGGPRPFTTRFTGNLDTDKIEGTSQAVGVGGGGAYLGHGGEVVQPEHPWSAKRVVNQPGTSADTGSNPKSPAKN
jgi:hypothetical protein